MIIFDELIYAENIIKNGYKNDKYIRYDNIILVKYWKYKGLDERQIREELGLIMDKFGKLYNQNILKRKIDDAMHIGMKYDLLTDVTVSITQGEIDAIGQLGNLRLEKMLFVLLVIWKHRGMTKRFRVSNADIMRLAGERMHGNTFWDCIYKITQTKMLSMVNYRNRAYYVMHIEPDGDEVVRINKFNDPVLYYLNLFEPEKYMNCEMCGVPVEYYKTRKYCEECARIVNIRRTVENRKKGNV